MKTSIAKSIMENEEGMNHLLIEIPPLDVQEAEVQIILPDGMFRTQNLTGYKEGESGSILIDHRTKWMQHLLIELYTKEKLNFEQATVNAVLTLKSKDGTTQFKDAVTVTLADEDNMEDLVVDENVITFLKNLQTAKEENVTTQPKTYMTVNEYAFLEEKYRVDF
jgi:ATP-dependent Clp protease protease subunit